MAAKPEDALYAWMIPYYAIVARRNTSALLGNPDSAWQALKEEINSRTKGAHAVLLDELYATGNTHDALAALARLWAPLAR